MLDERVLALDAVALVEHGLADVVEEAVELHVGVGHHAGQLEDHFDAGEVDAEVAGEGEDHLELVDLVFAVEARVAGRARGLDQPFALVETERLRMDVVSLRDDRDHHESV